MEYFVLQENRKLFQPLSIPTANNDFTVKDNSISLNAVIKKDTSIPDYKCVNKLFQYYFLVSSPLYELLEDFCGMDDGILTAVTDTKSGQQAVYYSIVTELVDCLVKKPHMDVNELTIYENRVKDKFLFRVKFENQEYLIVSLPLAENMLRANTYGINFIPVKTIIEEDEKK